MPYQLVNIQGWMEVGRKVEKSFELLQDWEGYYVHYIRAKAGSGKKRGKERLCKERFGSDANCILLSLNFLLQLILYL